MHPTVPEVPRDERNLLADLRLADEETNGRPTLTAEQASRAREWFTRLMVDGRSANGHIQLLQEFYQGTFAPPSLPRWLCREGPPPARRTDPNAGFRHYQLLPEEKALAVAERGPEALTDEELAVLLLNPFALWDLADLILTLLPRYWMDIFGAVGKEEMERLGRELPLPGIDYIPDEPDKTERRSNRRRQRPQLAVSLRGQASLESSGSGGYTLGFGDDAAKALQRKIAEHLYGDANRSFTLTLYCLPVTGQPEQVRAELEVAPAPTRSDLTLTITFPTGDRRAFALAIPPQPTDPEEEPRATTRSLPCAPLPAAAFEFKGGSEWRDEVWPPELVLRSLPETLRLWLPEGNTMLHDDRHADVLGYLYLLNCTAAPYLFPVVFASAIASPQCG
jgi:hypothetical protein